MSDGTQQTNSQYSTALDNAKEEEKNPNEPVTQGGAEEKTTTRLVISTRIESTHDVSHTIIRVTALFTSFPLGIE